MMNWEDFKLKFSKYHVPQGLIKKMRDEFRELKQGRMSVVEYRDRFLTLSSHPMEGKLHQANENRKRRMMNQQSVHGDATGTPEHHAPRRPLTCLSSSAKRSTTTPCTPRHGHWPAGTPCTSPTPPTSATALQAPVTLSSSPGLLFNASRMRHRQDKLLPRPPPVPPETKAQSHRIRAMRAIARPSYASPYRAINAPRTAVTSPTSCAPSSLLRRPGPTTSPLTSPAPHSTPGIYK
ncbi:hypothetical protein QYE76_035114 [Lolium multiflorum]|uniref:Retrotransposon gag domain-containing protein n=1 Tax=Lolium multiflorum TaxID=4521 RepID=A0AAD8R096_LOLMU|nr:hypothetical protein QYE76_035114 [Lolium multiflorum]